MSGSGVVVPTGSPFPSWPGTPGWHGLVPCLNIGAVAGSLMQCACFPLKKYLERAFKKISPTNLMQHQHGFRTNIKKNTNIEKDVLYFIIFVETV